MLQRTESRLESLRNGQTCGRPHFLEHLLGLLIESYGTRGHRLTSRNTYCNTVELLRSNPMGLSVGYRSVRRCFVASRLQSGVDMATAQLAGRIIASLRKRDSISSAPSRRFSSRR